MNNHKKIERFLEKIRVILKNINLKHAGTAVCVLAGVILVWLFAGMVASGSQPEETGEEALPAGVRLPGTEQASETEYAEDNRTQVLDYYNRIGVVYNVNGYLNIREKPEEDSRIIGKALEFSGLEITDDSRKGWYGISLGEGKTGYVSSEFVAAGTAGEKLAVEHAVYTAHIGNKDQQVLTEPEKGADVLTVLQPGDTYVILSEKNQWLEIQIRVGLSGYIPSAEADAHYSLKDPVEFGLSGLSEERADLLNLAWNYYGGKYVWGGTELGVGVDCSGYVMRLFEKFEVYLHRVSKNQATDGKEISFEEIRPGDLIFYNMKGGEVDHVALYTGNNKIIHAASAQNGIMVSEWDYLPVVCIRTVFGD